MALAILGGSPHRTAALPAWPPEDEAIRQALEQTYRDGDWGRYHGERLKLLQTRLADLHQVEYVWCCSSGTIAVELSLRGLRAQAGDEVILAGYDFSGNFRAVEAVGATPVLTDIVPQTWGLDVAALERARSDKTVAAIVSHLHGSLAPMEAIQAWAAEHKVSLVEDACQTPGGVVQDRPAGTWGDVGALSFGGSKLLTCGRGGAVLTKRADVHQRIKIYCERGNDAFALSELQAAVLPPQLEQLDARNQIRQENAMWLIERLRKYESLLAPLKANVSKTAGFYKIAWLYLENSVPRDLFLKAMRAEGVPLDIGFLGFARRSGRRCRKADELTASRQAGEQTVLLHHPVLLDREATEQTAEAMEKVLDGLEDLQ